jgi:hypothetical protein
MSDTYDLFPELSLEFDDALKPELEQILLFERDDKICLRIVFSQESGIQMEEQDLSYVSDDGGPMFTTKYSLESNAMLFLSMDKLSLSMVIGDAFTEEGIDRLLDS